MLRPFLSALLAVFLIGASLFLWRSAFPVGDGATLALVPLAMLMFLSLVPILRDLHQARLAMMLRADTPLRALVTGKLRALLGGLLFVSFSVPFLAYQALNMTVQESLALGAACFVSALVFFGIEHVLRRHFHRPFDRTSAAFLANWTCALLAFPLLAWVSWRFAVYPEALRAASFSQAVTMGMDRLPPNRGLVTKILTPLYAWQYAKAWCVLQYRDQQWLMLLLSLDTALFGFLATRATILLAALVDTVAFPYERVRK